MDEGNYDMRKNLILAAGLMVAALVASTGANAQLKPEEVLTMRKGLMLAVKTQAGPVLGFAQGKADLPADVAARAENLAALARMAPTAWGKGSESLAGANTKPEAFTSADFAKGWEQMAAAAAALGAAAKDGPDAIKAAAGNVGKTCKGCHDNFKKD